MPFRGDPIPATRPETPQAAMEQTAAKFGVKFGTETWDTILGASAKPTVFTLLARIPAYQGYDEAGETYLRALKFNGHFFVPLTDISKATADTRRLSDGFLEIVERSAEIASLKGNPHVKRIDLLEAISQSAELAASLGEKDAYFPEALQAEVRLLKLQEKIAREAGFITNNKLNREDREIIATLMETGFEAARKIINNQNKARKVNPKA